MKKILRTVCTLILACGFSNSTWAIDQVDGVYQIGTAQDFADFAQIVSESDVYANALLTADIDLTEMGNVAIGTTTTYSGTFDGGFHTITINRNQEGEGNALFGMLAGTVKNLNVTGTIVCNGKYASGLVAQATGDRAQITNCISTVRIESSVSGDGTHGGIVALNNGTLTVENCAFAGAFVGDATDSWGGFCGWSTGTGIYKNCLMIADVSATSSTNSNTFSRNPGNCTFTNCVYLNAFGNVPGGTIQITAEQLASGEACFILNGKKSEGCTWFQTIGTDTMPVPDNTHGTVYANGKLHCNGVAYEDGTVYSNTNEGVVTDEHDWSNGVCNFCHITDETYMTAAEDGFYEISTTDQLIWFAAMVNSDTKRDICGRLVAPINLEGIEWPSIGVSATPYNGTFDGQGYAIDNLNAPLFGSARGATLKNIAIESANINGRNTTLGNQTGSIVCVAYETTLTNSYSRAVIVIGDEGDMGGLAGKFTGTIKDCAFLGSISSAAWSEGGIAGSGEANAITIEDCLVYAELLTTGGAAKGSIIGWNDNATIKNCFTVQAPAEFNGFSGNTSGGEIDCFMLTDEEFATGDAAWKLNNKSFVNATWFQSLGEDVHPMLDPAKGVVYEVGEKVYTNDMNQLKEVLVESAREYADNVYAQKTLIDTLKECIDALEGITTYAELCTAYTAYAEARTNVEASASAYAQYVEKVNTVKAYLEENASSMAGPSLVLLESYLYDEVAPEDGDFPNGSYEYIIANMPLSAEQVLEEITYVQTLLDEAVRNGYAPGTEISTLLANANLDATPNFDGWTYTKQGSTLTVLRDQETTYTAEAWNATFDLKQTITGLSNGIYEIRMNGAFRAANNDYDGNNNYAAYLYANGNAVYVMTSGEDLISAESAVDKENAYLEGASNTDQLYDNGIISGYCPTGPIGCYYAFNAGRYENRIVAAVTDGTLTIGVKNVGTGCANDWIGFDNFRLFYLGSAEDAAEGITPTLEGMVARANTLLAYEADSGEAFRMRPNFSNELRALLEAAIAKTATVSTTEEKMELVAEFTKIFEDIHACKQAYITLEATIESLLAQVYEDPTATEEEKLDLQAKAATAMEKWVNGAYTAAQALAKEDLMQSIYCQRYLQGAPQHAEGVWQLATAQDMLWFARLVNEMGDVLAMANIVAPIDMSGIQWTPIGKASRPYCGKFNGELSPITNMNLPLFGTTNSATIEGIAIVGGTVGGNADYAAHTGSIIGHAQGTTGLYRSYSTAHMASSTGDCGGLIGKVSGSGTIKDAFFAGNLTAGWSAGCLVGSSDGTTIAEVSNCYVDATNVTYKNGDAHGLIVGWLHAGLTGNFHNVYVIAGAELTNIMGNTDNAAAAAEACKTLTAEEFASGAVAHKLNQGNETDPVWFQTLGSDACPVLDNSHMIVILNEDGTYSNKQGDAIDKVDMTEKLPATVNVYDMQGRMVKSNVKAGDSLNGLPHGLYIIGGKKVLR